MLLYYFIILILIVIVIFWLLFWWSSGKSKTHSITLSEFPKVAVIIAFKNEEKNLQKTIIAVLAQDYPNFELILVDDHSTDCSYKIASSIDDQRVRLLKNNTNQHGKKKALTHAINTSTANYLLFTDADCIPSSTTWITSMMSAMLADRRTEIVLGIAPFLSAKGLINLFARYENVLTAIQYITYATLGIPYMGVGRNLMYKKEYYERINGYNAHAHIKSGDDDLTVSAAANGYNTVVNIDKESFVYSAAPAGITAFITQKTRHITTSVHYRWYHQLLLGAFGMAHLLFWPILMVMLFFSIINWQLLLTIVLGKWFIQMILQVKFYKLLDTKGLLIWFPILDIMYSIYLWILLIYTPFRSNKWK